MGKNACKEEKGLDFTAIPFAAINRMAAIMKNRSAEIFSTAIPDSTRLN